MIHAEREVEFDPLFEVGGFITDDRTLIEVSQVTASEPLSCGASSRIRIAALAPPIETFRKGRDFAAWLGLTPRQHSSGGKQTLMSITKQGNRYLRKLLVLGATSLLNVVSRRTGSLRDWIVGLLAKKPARLVTVAIANKLARIIWAMMKTGECFRAELFAKSQTASV